MMMYNTNGQLIAHGEARKANLTMDTYLVKTKPIRSQQITFIKHQVSDHVQEKSQLIHHCRNVYLLLFKNV